MSAKRLVRIERLLELIVLLLEMGHPLAVHLQSYEKIKQEILDGKMKSGFHAGDEERHR